MLTARISADDSKNYERYYIIAGIDEETFRQAKTIFEEYRGVILNENFSDDEWLLTNQVTKITLRFAPSEFAFKKYAKKWIGCSYRCFVDGAKAYTAFHIGKIGLSSLREIVRQLILTTEKPCKDIPAEPHIIEFLKLLPDSGTKDQVLENLEEQAIFNPRKQTGKRQRVLADFDVYFRFNNALEEFWERADEQQKLFYFPLYFWWNLTAILPLRPTEFLLTPRQCLEKKNGKNILTVRRTILKGGGRKVFYSIAGDYKLMKYSVPDKIAAEIEKYIKATAGMPVSALDTLFTRQPHYLYLGKTVTPLSMYYSYQSLSYCLKKFQDDVLDFESDKNKINLGDTRHLAMISLIASGGSPLICKELAGHEDINISSHYYSNISRFVECATYEMYRKQKGVSVEILESKLFCVGETVEVNGGRCDSTAYIAGSIDDCVRNVGTGGELGHCITCSHFIDGKTGKYLLFSNTDGRKKQVDEDSRYLMHVIELVRKNKGCNEDIQSALLRLQHSSSRYSQCLYKNMGGL